MRTVILRENRLMTGQSIPFPFPNPTTPLHPHLDSPSSAVCVADLVNYLLHWPPPPLNSQPEVASVQIYVSTGLVLPSSIE